MKTANPGERIEWRDKKYNVKLTGTVRMIYVNSVLVDLDPTHYIQELELWESTIVAHKNYKIISTVNN